MTEDTKRYLIPRRRMSVLQAVSSIAAVVALVISLVAVKGELANISRERAQSAQDTCQVLKILILAAYPRDERPQANALISKVQLTDCTKFGQTIVHPPKLRSSK